MQPQNGKMPVPTLYDISGSANWTNKADVGLVVHRNFDTNQAEIHVQKVRDKWVGQPGRVTLDYDKATGRYSGQSPGPLPRAAIGTTEETKGDPITAEKKSR